MATDPGKGFMLILYLFEEYEYQNFLFIVNTRGI